MGGQVRSADADAAADVENARKEEGDAGEAGWADESTSLSHDT